MLLQDIGLLLAVAGKILWWALPWILFAILVAASLRSARRWS